MVLSFVSLYTAGQPPSFIRRTLNKQQIKAADEQRDQNEDLRGLFGNELTAFDPGIKPKQGYRQTEEDLLKDRRAEHAVQSVKKQAEAVFKDEYGTEVRLEFIRGIADPVHIGGKESADTEESA